MPWHKKAARKPDIDTGGRAVCSRSSILLADEPLLGVWGLRVRIPLGGHVQVMLVAKRRDGLHHHRGMVSVNGLLVLPAVDEQNRLWIVERLVVFVPQISLLGTDLLDRATGGHFACKRKSAAVSARVPQIHRYCHPELLNLDIQSSLSCSSFTGARTRRKHECVT